MNLEEYEKLHPNSVVEHAGARMIFNTPNRATAWRAGSLFNKEPDTIAWIGGFGQGDVLLDIGANVGMYSIFAAATRGAMVYAFEPESQNYALLNRNIHDNGLADRVVAFCAALSDVTSFHRLYLSEFVPGSSCHNFGEPVDYQERAMHSPYAQGCFSTTVDELVSQGAIPVPAHVKIDVDGIEPKVIAGARRTLKDPRVRSLLIEINTALDSHWEIIDWMLDAGFDYDLRQADAARRADGAFEGVGNYVFRR
ncbi:MAG: FkbM family methyltransferase [Burkholderiales bacterium]